MARQVYMFDLSAVVDRVNSFDAPLDRALAASDAMKAADSLNAELREIRTDAVRTLHALGWTYDTISAELGIGRARVQQLITAKALPRRIGVIEKNLSILAATMRAEGATSRQIAIAGVKEATRYRGGPNMPADRLADYLDVSVELVQAAIEARDELSP